MLKLYEKLHKYGVEMLTSTYIPNAEGDYFYLTIFFTFMKDDHVLKCPVAYDLLRLEYDKAIDILNRHLDKFVSSLE